MKIVNTMHDVVILLFMRICLDEGFSINVVTCGLQSQ